MFDSSGLLRLVLAIVAFRRRMLMIRLLVVFLIRYLLILTLSVLRMLLGLGTLLIDHLSVLLRMHWRVFLNCRGLMIPL